MTTYRPSFCSTAAAGWGMCTSPSPRFSTLIAARPEVPVSVSFVLHYSLVRKAAGDGVGVIAPVRVEVGRNRFGKIEVS